MRRVSDEDDVPGREAPPAGRKQVRGLATADRLLDAALELYGAEGPHGFTVHTVAAAGGVSVGSLYHHFGSFDGLSAALYSRALGELLDHLASATVPERTARAGIRAHTTAYLEFAGEHTASARYVHGAVEARFLPTHGAEIGAAKAERIRPILDWVRGHVRAGRIVDLPEPMLEMLIVGPVAETTRRWLAGVPGVDLDEAAGVLPERIWRSVRPGR
jgi:AcrR family transcriptional regulator